MNEIAAPPARALLDLAARAGLDVDAIVAGLPFDRSTIRRRRRVEWDDYCAIAERVEAACGGPDRFDELLESMFHTTGAAIWRRILRGCVGPRRLAQFMFQVLDPLWFPGTEFEMVDEVDGRVRVSIRLCKGRPCETVMRGTIAAARNLPLHLGLPPAEVEVEELTGTTLVLRARLPPSQSVVSRARTASASALQRTALRLIADLGSEVREQRGHMNAIADLGRELAQHVDLAELADALITILGKLGWPRVALSVAPLDGGAWRLVRRHGDGDTPVFQPLLAMGHTVGRLELGGTGDLQMVADLVPWVSLAVENARTFTALAATRDHAPAHSVEARVTRAREAWALTPRQADVLTRVVDGAANKEIAAALRCAENTVELHMTQLLRKAAVQSRAQLIARFWSASV